MLEKAREYLPTIAKALAAAGVACTITATAIADGVVTTEEGFTVAAAWLGVAAVWRVRNATRAE